MDQTQQYYESHAEDFFSNTINADLTAIYQVVLRYLTQPKNLLDIGCGSGRDLANLKKYFKGDCIGIEPSQALAIKAKSHSGCEILTTSFLASTIQDKFDLIWACASLLHFNEHDLIEAFKKIKQLLTPKGIVYCSFKRGDFAGLRNGRFFIDMTREKLQTHLPEDLTIKKVWYTKDVRKGVDTQWINVVLNNKNTSK